MIALMQLLFRYGFFQMQNIEVALTDFQYLMLVVATVAIAAAGYLINNVFDQATDRDNKPSEVIVGNTVSESLAYNIYVALNIIGVGLGFWLSNGIGRPGFAALFVVIAATLYLYASSFKRSLLVGNIIVSLLVSISILIVGIYDLYPILTMENRPLMGIIFQILIDYAIFAFIVNFIREIVKDLEDVNGDYNQGMSTLPIVLGVARTAKLGFGLAVVPVLALLWYTYTYIFHLIYAAIYMIVFVVAPMVYFLLRMWSAQSQKDFRHLSFILKLVLLFGILSILVISLNMKYNA
jgi:4-hydroxybenzoate polyprenyltransferase